MPHSLEVRGDRVDDLAVEVEAEVVARREVEEPAVADPDPPAVLLVDHGVEHRVGVLQPREVGDGLHPAIEPPVALAPERLRLRSGRSRPCRSRAGVGHQTSGERTRVRGRRVQPAAWNPYRPNGRGALHLQGGISGYRPSTDAARSTGASERLRPAGDGVPVWGTARGVRPLRDWRGSRTGTVRTMPTVGFHASHEQLSPARLIEASRAAEAAGFEAAMCSDHLAPWSERQGHSGHAWSWLGAAMQATELPFGVVTAPGPAISPRVGRPGDRNAGDLFPGRFWAALGSGEALNEHVTGDPWPSKPSGTRGSSSASR